MTGSLGQASAVGCAPTSGVARRNAILLLLFIALVAQMVLSPNASARQLAGVNAHLLWPDVDGAARRAQLDRLKEAGADVIRVDVGWSTLEARAKGTYEAWYLDRLDQLVGEAEQRHIELLLDVVDAPCWASSAPTQLKAGCSGEWWNRGVQRYAPNNPSDYADALEFLVRRYGHRVRGWEVENEPNLAHYFRAADPAGAYAGILKAAYTRAKAVDPTTFVVGGVLASSDAPFLRALLAHGIAGHFDAFSIHPYSENTSPLDQFPDKYISESFIRGVPLIHDQLVKAGAEAPLWLTEFGWSTCLRRGSPLWWENCVDERRQADYIEKAYRQMSHWSYVQAGLVYMAVDAGVPAAVRDSNFGILASDGREKPAYEAFRRSSSLLRAGTAAGWPGVPAMEATAFQRFRVTVPSRLRLGSPLPRLTRARTRRQAIRFRLSQPGRVTLRFERCASRRGGGCARWTSPRSVRLSAPAGRVTILFAGRLARRQFLPPGAARVVVTVRDRGRNVVASRAVSFRVVRR